MNLTADRRAILVYLLVTWTLSSLCYSFIISPDAAGAPTPAD